jgi:Histidine kinase-, DNA gyrase B-, and HSP90-like ATPase
MAELANSRLLRAALAERLDDPAVAARERLRSSYLHFKQRAELLAGEIGRSFPDLTVHDGTHLDAVWEMADLVAGDAVELNALEAYVLGGAILLHDLGLAVAAYPNPAALREEPRWSDAVAVALERRLGRTPSTAEIAAADAPIARAAEELLLRQLHAQHAERLALLHWTDDRGEAVHLIEDAELRHALGAVIGQLAHSHWWGTEELPRQFDAQLGCPAWCPAEWTVDLLRLACLLRAADALHLDAQRAPMFLRAVRRPSDRSAVHWSFQERLNRPFALGDRVSFTAGDRFGRDDSRAWWLCYETLRDADRWLREVDALLSDLGRTRLAIRGVVGVDHPQRLAQFVRTTGWEPVDTHIQVSNVAGLVAKLGGRELYGDDPTVAVRELIQNGADAVRARRRLQRRPADWGAVTVRMGTDEDGDWVEVEDEGVGMSEHVLTKALLDFGTSYWISQDLPAEFPGLLAGGFEAVGQFGIGFFAVFMLGPRVRITTRPYRAAEADTQVLTFDGLDERPLLRQADEAERLIDGGTRVRVWIGERTLKRLFARGTGNSPWTLAQVCTYLCPALDVPVIAEEPDGTRSAVSPTWKTLEAAELVSRVSIHQDDSPLKAYFDNLRPLYDADGELIGRLAIYPGRDHEWDAEMPGVLTVGGLRACDLQGIFGIAEGHPVTAARDDGIPLVSEEAFAEWASEQAQLLAAMPIDDERARDCAATVQRCGGDTGALAIADTADGALNAAAVGAWAAEREELIVVSGSTLNSERIRHAAFQPAPNVIAVPMGWSAIVQGSGRGYPTFAWPRLSESDPRLVSGSLHERAMRAVAGAWGLPLERVLDQTEIPTKEKPISAVIGRRDGREFIHPDARIVRRNPADGP